MKNAYLNNQYGLSSSEWFVLYGIFGVFDEVADRENMGLIAVRVLYILERGEKHIKKFVNYIGTEYRY